MDIKEFTRLAEERASHRKFLPDAVPAEDIKAMVDCARLAPSGHNFQPWRFVAIKNSALIKSMADAVEDNIQAMYKSLTEEEITKFESYKFFAKHFEAAPLVIAVFSREFDYISSKLEKKYNLQLLKAKEFNMGFLSTGGAINNLLLAAQTMGYGSCWMTEPVVYAQEAIERILGIEEPYKLVSLIPIGKPIKEKKGQERKSIDEILTILDMS